MLTGLLKTVPLTRPYGRRKNGNCSCNTEWCDEHNDCSWECWKIVHDTDYHMTMEQYRATQPKA